MKQKKLERLISKIMQTDHHNIQVSFGPDRIAHLEGETDTWGQIDQIGHAIGKKRGVKNVVSHLRVKGHAPNPPIDPQRIQQAKEKGKIGAVDVLIIGAGISGCGIARELSKYDMSICVAEKAADVAEGTSKANNGMIHPGNATTPFTLKAKMNVEGNALYEKWAKELQFEFHQTGSFVLAYDKEDKKLLKLSALAGKLNRVPGMRKMKKEEIESLEPHLPRKPIAGMFTPTTAYVDPYEVVFSLAENAAENGVQFYFNAEVLAVSLDAQNQIQGVLTEKGFIETKVLINAAGVHADDIAKMAQDEFYTLHGRKGGILIFDSALSLNQRALNGKGTDRSSHTKGGGLQQTVHGNPLWGPSAKEIEDKEDLSVTKEDFEYDFSLGHSIYPDVKKTDVIAYFAGVRAADYKEDFIIEPSQKTHGFIHVAGIQSPGLASAPAIAKRVEGFVMELLGHPAVKRDYNPIRKKPVVFAKLSKEAQDELIRQNSQYGHVVCRCETVTEAEIVAAIHAKVPATTLDGIKKRTRGRMGRCQGGFCGPKILSILARELNVPPTAIQQGNSGSYVIEKSIREGEK